MRKKADILIFIFTVVFFKAGIAYAFDGYGASTFRFVGNEAAVVEKAFKPLEQAGVGWIRLPFGWAEIERQKGEYDFKQMDRLVLSAGRHNLKVLGVISDIPGWTGQGTASLPRADEDWKRFVKTLVLHYKGKVAYWQIWNEPDTRKFRDATPEQYLAILKSAYNIIRGIDASIKVVSAGGIIGWDKGGFFNRLLALGMADYADIIAFHLYPKTPDRALVLMKNYLNTLNAYKVRKPVWVTEIGWQTGGWKKGHSIVKDEETKALYLKETFRLLRPYTNVIFWHKAVAGPKKFGLMEFDKDGAIALTPSYYAYKELIRKNK